MRRSVAIIWHALSLVLAAGLYFLFVLPRWWELSSAHVSHAQGTALRIVAGVVLALTAVPVFFTLRHARRPEFGTPQLALSLRTWSIAGQVLAGVLIIGTAIAEIWLSLDKAGPWLFGVYGAAAALAALSAIAFYVAFAAERPPAPPKPLKAKKTAKAEDTGPAVAVATAADEDDADDTTESAEKAEVPEELQLAEQTPRRGMLNKRPTKVSRGD